MSLILGSATAASHLAREGVRGQRARERVLAERDLVHLAERAEEGGRQGAREARRLEAAPCARVHHTRQRVTGMKKKHRRCEGKQGAVSSPSPCGH